MDRHDNTSRMEAERRHVPLSRLPDYQVADDSEDVRGWDVVSGDGREVGRVEDLLVNLESMKAGYLVIEFRDAQTASLAGGSVAQPVLVPADQVRLDPQDHRVTVDVPLHTLAASRRGETELGLDRDRGVDNVRPL